MSDSGAPSHSVEYDSFMTRDLQDRLETFNAISAENRASLVSTHIRRCKDANAHRLNSEQVRLTEEWLRFVTPDAYRLDRSEDVLRHAKDLESRTAAVFSRDDMAQALTIHGSYIPPRSGLE